MNGKTLKERIKRNDERLRDKEYNIFARSNVHSESVWCPFCYGSGQMRRRLGRKNLDPRIEIVPCSRCKGKRRVWVKKGSQLYKKAIDIVPGLWPRSNW